MKRQSVHHNLCMALLYAFGLSCAFLLAARPISISAFTQLQSSTRGRPAKPNIIFIMADDLGVGHLGCYGQNQIRTSNIDRLSQEGLRFMQAYAGCTVCAPSRSTLMTGLHMGHTPVRLNPGGIPLRATDVTVAEVLKKAGYATGIFGKWGLGDARTTGVPEKHGFDQSFGYLHQVHAHFYYPEYLWKNGTKFPLTENIGGKRRQYSHDLIVSEALQFVRAHRDVPFFLYLAPTIPHLELLVPEDSLDEYRGRFAEIPYHDPRGHYADQATPRAAIAGMITRLDQSVGQLMSLLEELNLDQNTIVFFTSDNGAQNGYGCDPDFFKASGPFRGYKQDLYEGGIRVPMIVRWRGQVRAGSVTDQIWAHWDFMTTATELAGARAPSNTDGVSLLPAILDKPQRQHPFYYWEFGETAKLAQAVRLGDWKAIRTRPGVALELYDLRRDAGEKNNVATEHPDVVARIEKIMKTARVEPPPQIEPPKEPGKKYQ
ncbi:MAG TPA: arylsulfatase [Acidobacteriota bacterium]|jgi:arylsulfatase A-like enzyme